MIKFICRDSTHDHTSMYDQIYIAIESTNLWVENENTATRFEKFLRNWTRVGKWWQDFDVDSELDLDLDLYVDKRRIGINGFFFDVCGFGFKDRIGTPLNGQDFHDIFDEVALYIFNLYGNKNCGVPLTKKEHPMLYNMYALGFTLVPQKQGQPMLNSGYCRWIHDLVHHVQETNEEKMNNSFDRAYHDTNQRGVRMIHLTYFGADLRTQYLQNAIYYTDIYLECKSLYKNNTLSLFDYGVLLVLAETQNSQPITDYECVSFADNCQSRYITICYPLTTDITLSGTADFLLSSHIPLQEIHNLRISMKDQENWQYMSKYQLLLECGEGVAYWGSTFHSVHRTEEEQLYLFYVLEIEEETININKIEQRKFRSVDYTFYGVNFEWIGQTKQYIQWTKDFARFAADDVMKTIDVANFIQFVTEFNPH